jgi:hypothetical protein
MDSSGLAATERLLSADTSKRLIVLRLRNLMLALVMAAVAPAAADASLILNLVDQLDGTVKLDYSGQINSTSFTSIGPVVSTSSIQPNQGLLQNAANVTYFLTGSGSAGQNFGTGGPATATSASGSPIYLNFAAPSILGLPVGYTSGAPLTGSMTFSGSLASLGATSGSYTFNWGGGGSGRSVILNVSAIPEPATIGILSIGSVLSGYGYRRRLKKGKQQAIVA